MCTHSIRMTTVRSYYHNKDPHFRTVLHCRLNIIKLLQFINKKFMCKLLKISCCLLWIRKIWSSLLVVMWGWESSSIRNNSVGFSGVLHWNSIFVIQGARHILTLLHYVMEFYNEPIGVERGTWSQCFRNRIWFSEHLHLLGMYELPNMGMKE